MTPEEKARAILLYWNEDYVVVTRQGYEELLRDHKFIAEKLIEAGQYLANIGYAVQIKEMLGRLIIKPELN